MLYYLKGKCTSEAEGFLDPLETSTFEATQDTKRFWEVSDQRTFEWAAWGHGVTLGCQHRRAEGLIPGGVSRIVGHMVSWPRKEQFGERNLHKMGAKFRTQISLASERYLDPSLSQGMVWGPN